MGLLDRIHNRKKFPVDLGDCTVYVRALKKSEFRRMDALEDDLKNAYFIGKALVNDSGSPELPQLDGEEDKAFAQRVEQLLDEKDIDTLMTTRLLHGISTVTKFDPDAIEKN